MFSVVQATAWRAIIGALLLSTTALPAPAAAQMADWSIYKPDQKFSAVFGRSVAIKAAAGGHVVDPTLNQALRSSGAGVNSFARDSVKGLLKSVVPGTPKGCTGLMEIEIPWVRILSTEIVPAVGATPSYCKVLAVIDKEITFEVDLPPPTEWNGNFLMGGSGGFLGNLQNNSKAIALERRYATAVTDTGHKETDSANAPAAERIVGGASWALRNPERLVNFGYRGTHLAAANAKLIIQAYYGKVIGYSYFSGSSGSGRQAMMESQRYPADFQGILAKCPGYSFANMMMNFAWTQQSMFESSEDMRALKPVIARDKVALLDRAVTDKCDNIDGIRDGDIADPRKCNFDPMTDLPRCAKDIDGPKCFTSKQAAAIAKIHEGASNTSLGQLYPGYNYGNEGNPGSWISEGQASAYVIGNPTPGAVYSARHSLLANEMLKYFVFDDPKYDLHSFDFERDVAATYLAAAVIDANNADLTGLKQSGTKMIIQQGWADWASNALATIEYYERAGKQMGGFDQVTPFARLFLMPSIGHCETPHPGSKTPHMADFLTALEQWVEKDVAPERIIASHVASPKPGETPKIDRTRPLCPYPKAAHYKGTGSIEEADSFVCRAPAGPVGAQP